MYEIVIFYDEISAFLSLFTKLGSMCNFVQPNGCFIQASSKGLHTLFLPPKFALKLNTNHDKIMKREINIDYIGVVRREGKRYIYEERDIIANEKLNEQLRTMAEAEDKSILDMQACLAEYFGDGDHKTYDYVLPHLYKIPFVDRVCYPDFMIEQQYENERAKVAESVEYEDDVEATLAAYNSEVKGEFLDKALRYIAAVDFAATAEQIKKDPAVILSSHEEIGWSKWEYDLGDSIKITLNTNLGMGAVSYMTVDVCYRGIVLPSFSHLVKHYDVRPYELSSHTIAYTAERQNWEHVLHFICNVLCDNGWIYDYGGAEVAALEKGLKAIATDPSDALNKMSDKPKSETYLSAVSNMLQADCDKYERYPIETATVFKVRKITGALRLVKSLRLWTDIYPYAREVADYIEQLNRELSKTLLEDIATQHQKIERLNERLDPLTAQWRDIEAQLDENPEDAEMLISKGRLDEKIDTLLNEIVARDDFMKTLQQCYAKITKAGILN